MADEGSRLNTTFERGVSRRSFLRWGVAVGGGAAAAGAGFRRRGAAAVQPPDTAGYTIVPSGCAHNCGGHCVLKAWVKDGRIARITTDDRPDSPRDPQLRACPKGRAYRRRIYHPDRLKYPMKRVGERGEGRFERISWDEAATLIADAMRRVRDAYGPPVLQSLRDRRRKPVRGSRCRRACSTSSAAGSATTSYSFACARWAGLFAGTATRARAETVNSN